MVNMHAMPEQMRNFTIIPKVANIINKIMLQHPQKEAHAGPKLNLRQVGL